MFISRSSVAVLATVFGIFAANAQQLPNADFETWTDCIPWTSKNNTTVVGTTPTNWCISNVSTMSVKVGSEITVDNSTKAVQLKNVSMVGNNIPGYISLGTTWSTSQGIYPIKNKDGGTFGGIDFTYNPDAIQFDYKRINGSGSTQPATVIYYSWIGTTTQNNVPGNIATTGSPTKTTMINRDRNVLGMTCATGDTPTYSANFELLSYLEYKITTPSSEWSTATLEIPYLVSGKNPEMANVIFAANDYFGDASSVKKDDELDLDNVKLIYYSRLSSLKINGTEIDGFASDKYNYTVATPYSTDNTIDATVLGRSAKIESVTYNDTDYTATIKVSNVDADNDGETSHTYVIQFAEPAKSGVLYEGIIKIYMGGDPMELSDQKVVITSTGDDTCDFALENFTLDGDQNNSLGDILVKDVKITTASINGKNWKKYTGSTKGLSLAAGQIICDVDLEGYEDDNKNLVAFIHVKWIMDPTDETSIVPIEVEFRTNNFETVTGIDNIGADNTDATPHYYLINGVEVKEPTAPGLYIVRRGNKVEKIVK